MEKLNNSSCISSENHKNLYFSGSSSMQSGYLCRSRDDGINFTQSLLEKDSSIQDFRGCNKKRKYLLTVHRSWSSLPPSLLNRVKLAARKTTLFAVEIGWVTFPVKLISVPAAAHSEHAGPTVNCWDCRSLPITKRWKNTRPMRGLTLTLTLTLTNTHSLKSFLHAPLGLSRSVQRLLSV